MSSALVPVALIGAVVLGTNVPQHRAPPTLVVITAFDMRGAAAPEWLAIIRRRSSAAQYDSVAAVVHPATPSELAWDSLVRSRVPGWRREIPALAAPYRPAVAPSEIHIILGNRGGDDAFTADPRTIGFDLAVLGRLYGDPHDAANQALIDRFFRHEFNHIMQKAWLAGHPWPAATPLDAALLDIWTEGLGNFYSLSGRWVDQDHHATPLGAATLTDLEPVFTARISALACADSSAAPALLAGFSSGPFAKKWGAVPAALWLATEPGPPEQGLRRFVVAGPAGVWDLAERHLTPALRDTVVAARRAASSCPRKSG